MSVYIIFLYYFHNFLVFINVEHGSKVLLKFPPCAWLTWIQYKKLVGLYCCTYISYLLSYETMCLYVHHQENKGNQTWMKPYIEQYQVIRANVLLIPTPTWTITRSGGSRGTAGMASSSTPWAAAWRIWRCRFLNAGRSLRLKMLTLQSKKQRMRKDQMETIIESQVCSLFHNLWFHFITFNSFLTSDW